MRSRKDQVQAYFFIVGRLIASLLMGRPDPQERPNKRLSVGILVGFLLSILLLAGFAIYGLFRPGGTNTWRTPGSIILVKETGARYLLLDNQLRPVLNYASARLVLKNGAPITSVASRSLSGVPVGAPIGIPGAPDALPAVDRLYSGAWTVCARRPDPLGPVRTTLLLNGDSGTVVPDERGLLVSTPDNVTHLIWQGRRYRLASAAISLALGYGSTPPIPVTAAWLNPVPSGRDLAFPAIPGRGSAGPVVDGRPGIIGQVYEVSNPAVDSSELYLLRADGLVRLSRTAAALILADPGIRQAYPNTAVTTIHKGPGDLGGVPMSPGAEFVTGYPPTPPHPVNEIGTALPCVRQTLEPGGGTRVVVTAVPSDLAASAMSVSGPALVGSTADEVVISVGTGMVARNRAAPGAAAGALYLVSEFGVKFPLPDDDAATALGYGGVTPVDVPSELLALLPTGPVLSPTAALASQPVGQ